MRRKDRQAAGDTGVLRLVERERLQQLDAVLQRWEKRGPIRVRDRRGDGSDSRQPAIPFSSGERTADAQGRRLLSPGRFRGRLQAVLLSLGLRTGRRTDQGGGARRAEDT